MTEVTVAPEIGATVSVAEISPPKTTLTEKDRKYLKEGGVKLMREVLKDFPQQLPDAVILPETSARPLVDLLEPVFEQFSADRQTRTPRYYFYDANASDSGVQAQAILDELRKTGVVQPSLAIVDDYASIAAKTIGKIRSSFGEEMPAYVFIAESYHYPSKIKVAFDVRASEDLRGGFDYRQQKVGAKFKQEGINPVKEDMANIGKEIAVSLKQSK